MIDAIGSLTRFGRRILTLVQRGRFDADLEQEMRLHQDLREQEQLERGLSPEEARYAVLRRFGNQLVLREESRDMWSWNWIETFLQDIRYGLRTLAKSPRLRSGRAPYVGPWASARTPPFSSSSTRSGFELCP